MELLGKDIQWIGSGKLKINKHTKLYVDTGITDYNYYKDLNKKRLYFPHGDRLTLGH